jgi:GTP-binding protein
LIEGAHEGVGLGDAFLRHVERTRVLVHLLDMLPLEGTPEPDEAYRVLRDELAAYSPILAAKPHIIAANKMDLTGTQERLHTLRQQLPDLDIIAISAATGTGLNALAERAYQIIEQEKRREEVLKAQAPTSPPPTDDETVPEETFE